MRAILAAIALSAVAATGASATTFTFDTAESFTQNFRTDVIAGDSGTQFRSGYDGSDGGFVHLNTYSTGNSLQFLNGPVTLVSLDVSSAYWSCGYGVAEAKRAGQDYLLTLLDAELNVLYSQTQFVAANGAWSTVNLGVDGVSVIHVAARWSQPGVYDGFWPNFDNIVTAISPVEIPGAGGNVSAPAVPVPAAFPLLSAGLAALGLVARRRSKARS